MRHISAVGFDLDYTLAQYRPETFEHLAHTETVKKLVTSLGYSERLYDLPFEWYLLTRGLVIDKARGNILKIDRHNYVKIAYHGCRQLTQTERREIYNSASQAHSFEEPHYALLDTLFSLAEAQLFMRIVSLAEADPSILPPLRRACAASPPPGAPPAAAGGWEAVYVDLRQAVDLCHRDGSIKKRVAQDPGKYLHPDPTLVPLLESLRAGGKKLFLATNSLWDYSDVVMRWLVDGQTAAQARDGGEGPRWVRYFDAVLTGCGKPHFFTQRRDLFRVDTRTMALYNQQEGSPMTVDDGAGARAADLPGGRGPGGDHTRFPHDGSPPDGRPAPARVFQGGSYQDLHRLLGVTSGSQVLYAGDHIYGDVLRSKRDLGWRTVLVIPELRAELRRGLDGGVRDMEALRSARAQLDACEEELHLLRWQEAELGRGEGSGSSACRAGLSPAAPSSPSLQTMQERCREMRLTHRRELQHMHRAFHPIWGALLKAGYKNSRYARQVERYACLYTSHVANLAFYSPEKSWMARMDVLAHEEEPCFSRETLKAREDE